MYIKKRKLVALSQGGYTVPELFFSFFLILVLGFLIVYLIGPASVVRRVRNLSVQIAMKRLVLDVESHHATYGGIPSGYEFFDSLNEGVIRFNDHCSSPQVGDPPSYFCIFQVEKVALPETCDSSHWSSNDKDVLNKQCYMKYAAMGNVLEGMYSEYSSLDSPRSYRIYAKSWNPEGTYYVYDSKYDGGYYLCPGNIKDTSSLNYCEDL